MIHDHSKISASMDSEASNVKKILIYEERNLAYGTCHIVVGIRRTEKGWITVQRNGISELINGTMMGKKNKIKIDTNHRTMCFPNCATMGVWGVLQYAMHEWQRKKQIAVTIQATLGGNKEY